MRGAGGTSGGLGHFFIGLAMMCGGFYMLLNAITVSSNFGMGNQVIRLFRDGKLVCHYQWYHYAAVYFWHRHDFLQQ